jgi:pyroglutamyl-peptidase
MVSKAPRILLAGFGPFPGAARNPSSALVRRLARLRRPALDGANVTAHVFPTRYEAVDRELAAFVNTHSPDIILLFGLASRRRRLSVEMRARNLVSSFPDAGRGKPNARRIADRPAALALPHGQCVRLLRAAAARGLPAALSRDAGRYVCNYALWRALEARSPGNAAPTAAFIHIPNVVLPGTRRGERARPSLAHLTATAQDILLALVAEARRARR